MLQTAKTQHQLSQTNIDSDVVVSVKNVAKKFCKHLKRSMAYGIVDLSKNLAGIKPETTQLRKEEFWSLNEIDFDLRRGEIVGLIGRNGSGKTTLLRLLAGIFPPDKGEIKIFGRVGALISVGAGFHPHMTGRENIYLNAAILQMTRKETEDQFDKIVDFADIGDFLDAPVSTYSSGMRIRLGFAIATAIQPDVLLLDEILAVGDARFRNKCYNRMGKIGKDSVIIFVSHNLNQIAQICNRCIYLENGKVAYIGDVAKAIHHYEENDHTNDDISDSFRKVSLPIIDVDFKWSSLSIDYGEYLDLYCTIETLTEIPQAIVRIPIYNLQGLVAAEWNSQRLNQFFHLQKGKNFLKIRLGPLYLKNGHYKLSFALNDGDKISVPFLSFKEYLISVKGNVLGNAEYQLPFHSDQTDKNKG